MALFTDTITLYNHLPDDTWQRTVLSGVLYSEAIERIKGSDGKITRSAVINVTIPETAECGREYISSRDFKKLDDVSGHWTLNPADNLDVIILGEVEQELTAEYRLKDLKADYNCVTVASITDGRNRNLLKNIKVVCK